MSSPPAPRDAARWLTPFATLIVAALVIAWCWFKEGDGVTLVFALATTFGFMAAVLLASRRLFFSSVVMAGMVGAVLALGWLKQARGDMILHAWDIVEFVTAPDIVSALWADRRATLLGGMACVAMFMALLAWLFRLERPLARRLPAALALALCLGVGAYAGWARPVRAHMQYFWFDLHLASFYGSFREAFEALPRGGLFTAATRSTEGPFPPDPICAPERKPPHILLIHEESVMDPALFPDLRYDEGVKPFFRSDDGASHALRVETYGGASWLTEFSIFSGVSTNAFGSMRNFVQAFTTGKLRDALPRVLAGCGYRNLMFTPWDKTFMAVARFYESIGFSEVIDRKSQGAGRDDERDRFYFGNALRRIEDHVTTSRQPLFEFIETLSAHWPYDVVYMPEVAVPGGGPGTPAGMSEYLRRLAMIRMDDDWLRAELARRFPGERFLLVRYGDHHPTATLPLLGKSEALSAEEAAFPPDSPAYITFYAVNGVGYAPPPLPAIATVDVGYLGAILLAEAGLPAPPAWAERARLMMACDGRFWTCADHDAVLAFNRRLLDAGHIPSK